MRQDVADIWLFMPRNLDSDLGICQPFVTEFFRFAGYLNRKAIHADCLKFTADTMGKICPHAQLIYELCADR